MLSLCRTGPTSSYPRRLEASPSSRTPCVDEVLEVSGSGHSEERRDLTTAVELLGAYLLVKATDQVVGRALDEAIDRVAAALKAAWSITLRRRD